MGLSRRVFELIDPEPLRLDLRELELDLISRPD